MGCPFHDGSGTDDRPSKTDEGEEPSPHGDATAPDSEATATDGGATASNATNTDGEATAAGSNGHGSGGGRGSLTDRTVDRRSFLRTALAIGGSGALAAVSGCTTRSDPEATDAPGALDVPRGRSPDDYPERQHAWNADLKADPFGNGVLPSHQLLLFLNYARSGAPTAPERETTEAAFETLDRAVQRLSGGDPEADNDGLVSMVGYSPTYFDRFDADLPGSLDLQRPETVLRRTGGDPDRADHYDAVVVLSSDRVPVLLAAEEALFGGLDAINGVDVQADLSGVFDVAERRTAFTGKGLPREKLDNEDIHEDAPLSMGYKSGFEDNLATEDAVTIDEGPFAGGTTLQVSKLRLDLGAWYDNDRETRDHLMFSREHSGEDIGEIGENLGTNSEMSETTVADLESNAKETGRVGHAAKAARARDEDFRPRILRRSEGVNNDFHSDGRVDFNFTAVMAGIEDFVATRQAMNSPDLSEHVEEGGDGIVSYMETTNRATFLVPPRSRRALPGPGTDS